MWLRNMTRARLVVTAGITAFSVAAIVTLNHQQVTAVRNTITDTAEQECSFKCQDHTNNTDSPASKPRFGHYVKIAKISI